jgi:hypothetical protein
LRPKLYMEDPKLTDTSSFLDITIPNTARIFNYLLGGSANFEVDRAIAEQMLEVFPSLRKWVRLRHAFAQEAAQVLHEQGFVQFLDLGSGLPTAEHIHTATPGARVIYSDINPVAVSYGQSLFAPLQSVEYIQGDARHIQEILRSPVVYELIDLEQPVAIGLNAVPVFLSREENRALARALFAWAPYGSKIFVVFQTKQGVDEDYKLFQVITRTAGLPMQLYTLEENLLMMKPWQVERLEPLIDFLGLPADFVTDVDRGAIDIAFHAAFLTNP